MWVTPDHIHLLLQLSEKYGLSEVMRCIKGNFARKFNEWSKNNQALHLSNTSDISDISGNISDSRRLNAVYKVCLVGQNGGFNGCTKRILVVGATNLFGKKNITRL